MDDNNAPKCSHDPDQTQQDQSVSINSILLPLNDVKTPTSFNLLANTISNYSTTYLRNLQAPLTIKASDQMPITNQPRIASAVSPISIIRNCPQTLFVQALSKLNESSLNFSLLNYLQSNLVKTNWKDGDITPPDSLTSAPPSYSFVLRQIAARRRPRLMGTFIPSPSFVQHTPPPTYATAFDIYIDPGPPPQPRVYTYGFTSMPVVCPECGYSGMTITTCKITLCTHLCAFILCLFCCWICAPLPYVLRSCKDVYHYCRNCRNFMGMYCPTNPESSYPTRWRFLTILKAAIL